MLEVGLLLILLGYFLVSLLGNQDWTNENKIYNSADYVGAVLFMTGILIAIISIVSFFVTRIF